MKKIESIIDEKIKGLEEMVRSSFELSPIIEETTSQRVEREKQLATLASLKKDALEHIFELQRKSVGVFSIPRLDIRESCPHCQGLGIKFFLHTETIEEDCPVCLGTGLQTETCKKCQGQGKVLENGALVTCRTCKGSGVFVFRGYKDGSGRRYCRKCQGKGKLYKSLSDGKIEKSFRCKTCQGTGKRQTLMGKVIIIK